LVKEQPVADPYRHNEGKLIFRFATARSMKSAGGGPNAGKPGWVHPGRKPSDFVTKAKKKLESFLRTSFESVEEKITIW